MDNKKAKAVIFGYAGFGDCIYQFPFVREASKKYNEVYLYTPFPFLYESLPNVKFIPLETKLATCTEIINQYEKSFWHEDPLDDTDVDRLRFNYHKGMKSGRGMIECWDEVIPIPGKKIDFQIPLRPEWLKEAGDILRRIGAKKKICLIKPPGYRKEWPNTARIPKPEYFQHLIDAYQDEYYFLSIGNRNHEKYVGKLRGIDYRFDFGELSLKTILGLTALSDMVIAYISMLFACAVATGTKAFCLFGGYSPAELWIDTERMPMDRIGYLGPDEPCSCLDIRHDCKRDLDLEKLDKRFADLHNRQTGRKTSVNVPRIGNKKRNMLICRVRAERAAKVAQNPYIRENFNVFTVDHDTVTSYLKHTDVFARCYTYPTLDNPTLSLCSERQERNTRQVIAEILDTHKIELVINAQRLHPYTNWMDEACRERDIKRVYAESFFDERMILDWTGLQYDYPNDITRFIDLVPCNESPVLPYGTRENQPPFISKKALWEKYGTTEKTKTIIVLGQLLWDMSLKKTPFPCTGGYVEWLASIFNLNTDTMFLFKMHPRYSRIISDEMEFLMSFPNVQLIEENLDSLFEAYDYFLAYSSTTIFEGLIKGKVFATGGYHLCGNDFITYQIKNNRQKEDLHTKMRAFTIDPDVRHRYLSFICNYYAVPLGSKKLYDKLTMDPHDFYSGRG